MKRKLTAEERDRLFLESGAVDELIDKSVENEVKFLQEGAEIDRIKQFADDYIRMSTRELPRHIVPLDKFKPPEYNPLEFKIEYTPSSNKNSRIMKPLKEHDQLGVLREKWDKEKPV